MPSWARKGGAMQIEDFEPSVEQEDHVERILDTFEEEMPIAYRRGAFDHREEQGNIWDMPIFKLNEEKRAEARDAFVYSQTEEEVLLRLIDTLKDSRRGRLTRIKTAIKLLTGEEYDE